MPSKNRNPDKRDECSPSGIAVPHLSRCVRETFYEGMPNIRPQSTQNDRKKQRPEKEEKRRARQGRKQKEEGAAQRRRQEERTGKTGAAIALRHAVGSCENRTARRIRPRRYENADWCGNGNRIRKRAPDDHRGTQRDRRKHGRLGKKANPKHRPDSRSQEARGISTTAQVHCSARDGKTQVLSWRRVQKFGMIKEVCIKQFSAHSSQFSRVFAQDAARRNLLKFSSYAEQSDSLPRSSAAFSRKRRPALPGPGFSALRTFRRRARTALGSVAPCRHVLDADRFEVESDRDATARCSIVSSCARVPPC